MKKSDYNIVDDPANVAGPTPYIDRLINNHVTTMVHQATDMRNGRGGVGLGSPGYYHHLYGTQSRFMPYLSFLALWTYLARHNVWQDVTCVGK